MSKEQQDRLKKYNDLKNQNIDIYPANTNYSHTLEKAGENFSELEGKEITLAGRLNIVREHGKISFADLKDGTGELQICFQEGELGEKSYNLFLEDIDRGDFLEVQGELFKTRRGEKTLKVKKWQILAKSLSSLPEKWHGLEDVEKRFRKRYLDLLANQETREIFEKRSRIITEIRRFLNKKDFLEVETPILQNMPGGATAKPFVTHHNALDIDLYLRIAPELYLKRLIIGGFDRVYEVAKCFRNEGIDREHNPEFTQVEFYMAYKNYNDLMDLTENLLKEVIGSIQDDLKVNYQGKIIDFSGNYERVSYKDIIKEYTKIDLDKTRTEKDLREKAKDLGLKIEK